MSFQIPREQQKVFIDHFMDQVLDLALALVDEGTEPGSPGATVYAVAEALARQLYQLGPAEDAEP